MKAKLQEDIKTAMKARDQKVLELLHRLLNQLYQYLHLCKCGTGSLCLYDQPSVVTETL